VLLCSYKIGRPLVFIWLHSVYKYANVDNGFLLRLLMGVPLTHIATGFKTKAAFKAAAELYPTRVTVYDPSIFDPVSGTVLEVARKKGTFVVTNHPKRSWFASVRVKEDHSGVKVL